MVVDLNVDAQRRPKIENGPRHVAIIMDGNGRWARSRGLPRLAGHRAGTDNIRSIIRACVDYDIKVLTIYAFSTENWGRPQDEVRGLMSILGQVIRREVKNLVAEGVKFNHIGRLDQLPRSIGEAIRRAMEETKDCAKITLNIAFNYGGRQEIVDAVRRIVADQIALEDINEELISRYLYTAGQPDPDLIIRTAGEMRLSNYLIWQSAYAEYYATPLYWPDFNDIELGKALLAYSQRERRFGKLNEGGSRGASRESRST